MKYGAWPKNMKWEKWFYSVQGPGEIIDLAVEGGDFIRFSIDVNEDTSTLLKFDIVDLDEKIQEELMESIQREGRVLYEKIWSF